MFFHPRAGICEGISADRPRPASSGLRSPVAGLASPDRRRANPNAISRRLNPIAHKGACSDDVAPAVPDRCTSRVLMGLLLAAIRGAHELTAFAGQFAYPTETGSLIAPDAKLAAAFPHPGPWSGLFGGIRRLDGRACFAAGKPCNLALISTWLPLCNPRALSCHS